MSTYDDRCGKEKKTSSDSFSSRPAVFRGEKCIPADDRGYAESRCRSLAVTRSPRDYMRTSRRLFRVPVFDAHVFVPPFVNCRLLTAVSSSSSSLMMRKAWHNNLVIMNANIHVPPRSRQQTTVGSFAPVWREMKMGIRSAGRTAGAGERCVADEAEICIDVFVKPFDRPLTARTAAVRGVGVEPSLHCRL